MKLTRILNYILFLPAVFICSLSFGQSNDVTSLENKLIDVHGKVWSSLNVVIKTYNDSVKPADVDFEYYIEKLETDFIQFITGNPKTLGYPFKRLQDSGLCRVTTSADGNFRVYDLIGWQLRTEIYQWQNGSRVFTKVFKNTKDSFNICRKIYSLQIKGQTHYLPVIGFTLFWENAMLSVTAFRIKDNVLDSVALFKNKEGRLNRIEVPISLGNFMKDSLRNILITYDDKQHTLYVPLTDEYGLFTKKYAIYELKDSCLQFTHTGEMKLEKPVVISGP